MVIRTFPFRAGKLPNLKDDILLKTPLAHIWARGVFSNLFENGILTTTFFAHDNRSKSISNLYRSAR